MQIEGLEKEREVTLRLLSEAQNVHEQVPTAEKSVLLEEARRRAKERALLSDFEQKPVKKYLDGTEEKEPAYSYSGVSEGRRRNNVKSEVTLDSNQKSNKDAVEFKHFIDKEYMQLKQELENLRKGSKVPPNEPKKIEKPAISKLGHSWEPDIEIKYKERPTRDGENLSLRLKVPEKPIENIPISKRETTSRAFTTESTRIDIVPDPSRKSPVPSAKVNNELKSLEKSGPKIETFGSINIPVHESQKKSNNGPDSSRGTWGPPNQYIPQQPMWNGNQYTPYHYPIYQYPAYPYNYPYPYQENLYQYPINTTPPPQPLYTNFYQDRQMDEKKEIFTEEEQVLDWKKGEEKVVERSKWSNKDSDEEKIKEEKEKERIRKVERENYIEKENQAKKDEENRIEKEMIAERDRDNQVKLEKELKKNEIKKKNEVIIVDEPVVETRKAIFLEIGQKQQKSLAQIFKEKNKKAAEKIHNREDLMQKQDHKDKTKEELIEIRKNLVKAPKLDSKKPELIEIQIEEKKLGKEPSFNLMERLSGGQRAKVSHEEMIRLNKKNYKLLPEVKKRQEEDRKKAEKQERLQKAKEYERVIIK